MTPLASRMVRAAIRAARRPRPDAFAIAEMLDVALDAEGEPPEGPGGGERTVSKDALRMRDKRAAEKAERDANGTPNSASNTDEQTEQRSLRVVPDVPNIAPNVREHFRVVGGKGGDPSRPSTGDTLSDSEDLGECERASGVRTIVPNIAPNVRANSSPVRTVLVPGGTVIVTLDLAMPGDCRGIAQMQDVQDIGGAWAKFCGHFNGKAIELMGRWQYWCVDEARKERSQRDRVRRGGGRGSTADPAIEEESNAQRGARQRAIEEAGRG